MGVTDCTSSTPNNPIKGRYLQNAESESVILAHDTSTEPELHPHHMILSKYLKWYTGYGMHKNASMDQ